MHLEQSDRSDPSSGWLKATILFVGILTILAFTQWPAYPYFLDSYYHLAVIQGFRDSNGIVLHSFWEAAPEGRPHLYPPLFHLLWLPVQLCGVPSIVMARCWTFLAFPLLLICAWAVLFPLTTASLAFWTVAVLGTPYIFFLSTVNYLPATMVLILSLLLIFAVDKKRWIAGGLLVGLAFWLHAGLPWLILLSLIFFALFEPTYRTVVWKIIALGVGVASPWLLHLHRHLDTLQLHARSEDQFLEIPLILLGLGLLGTVPAWKKRGIHRFFVALGLGFVPMMAGYRFRFFSAQGLFPFLLLAGIFLDEICTKIRRHRWALFLGLGVLLLATPSFCWSPQAHRWVIGESTLLILSGHASSLPRANAKPLFHERFLKELSDKIRAETEPDDLLFCNSAYFAGMLNVVTGRAITNEMLREMTDRPIAQQIAAARMIVWLKNPDGKPNSALRHLVSEYSLEPAGETEIAFLYKNPRATSHRRIQRAFIRWWVASLLVGIIFYFIAWDLKRE